MEIRDISTLEWANTVIYALLKQERRKIAEVLKKDENLEVKFHSGINSHFNIFLNKEKTINDYRNYLWLSVYDKATQNRYWITMFYNDVDKKSGNFHTQFGRIQFWRVDKKENGRISPNQIAGLEKNCCTVLFDESKSKDPHLWIDSPMYCAHKVVDDFLDWKNEVEKNESKAQKAN